MTTQIQVGDTILLGDQAADVSEIYMNDDGIPIAIARWQEEQSDGNQVVAVRLDAFSAESVEPH